MFEIRMQLRQYFVQSTIWAIYTQHRTYCHWFE